MAKMYHVTVQARQGAWSHSQVEQHDVLAASMDVAVKRALSLKKLRTAKAVRIEAALSNHGEYDKVKWSYYGAEGKTLWSLRNQRGTLYVPPGFMRRSEKTERIGIEAQRALDNCPEAMLVIGQSKGIKVAVPRVGTPYTSTPDETRCLLPIDAEGRCAQRHWVHNPGVEPAGSICGA